MALYNVSLNFGRSEAASAEQAATQIYEAFFSEAFYQPNEFEVIDQKSGEVISIDLTHLRTNNTLYGPQNISEKIRSQFSFVISEAFEIPSRGSVLTGQVSSGIVKAGDFVKLKSNSKEINLTVAFIEKSRNLIKEAYFTEEVGLMFKDINLSFINPGDTLVAA